MSAYGSTSEGTFARLPPGEPGPNRVHQQPPQQYHPYHQPPPGHVVAFVPVSAPLLGAARHTRWHSRAMSALFSSVFVFCFTLLCLLLTAWIHVTIEHDNADDTHSDWGVIRYKASGDTTTWKTGDCGSHHGGDGKLKSMCKIVAAMKAFLTLQTIVVTFVVLLLAIVVRRKDDWLGASRPAKVASALAFLFSLFSVIVAALGAHYGRLVYDLYEDIDDRPDTDVDVYYSSCFFFNLANVFLMTYVLFVASKHSRLYLRARSGV